MKRILILAAVAALTACSDAAVDEKNASVEEVSEKVREASSSGNFIRPGQWQSSVSIEDISMPGMPAKAVEDLKRMAQAQTSRSCLTPEEAKRPSADFFSGNDQCRYDHFRMGDGKIDAKMRCTQGGATQIMEMAGTYSPDAYEMRVTAVTDTGGAGEGVRMQMRVEANRIGECTGQTS